jgi:hypothetical protein
VDRTDSLNVTAVTAQLDADLAAAANTTSEAQHLIVGVRVRVNATFPVNATGNATGNATVTHFNITWPCAVNVTHVYKFWSTAVGYQEYTYNASDRTGFARYPSDVTGGDGTACGGDVYVRDNGRGDMDNVTGKITDPIYLIIRNATGFIIETIEVYDNSTTAAPSTSSDEVDKWVWLGPTISGSIVVCVVLAFWWWLVTRHHRVHDAPPRYDPLPEVGKFVSY